MLSRTVPVGMGEGRIASKLGAIQADYPDVSIGSYPKMLDGAFATDIVLRARDAGRLDLAAQAVEQMVAAMMQAVGSGGQRLCRFCGRHCGERPRSCESATGEGAERTGGEILAYRQRLYQ